MQKSHKHQLILLPAYVQYFTLVEAVLQKHVWFLQYVYSSGLIWAPQ